MISEAQIRVDEFTGFKNEINSDVIQIIEKISVVRQKVTDKARAGELRRPL